MPAGVDELEARSSQFHVSLRFISIGCVRRCAPRRRLGSTYQASFASDISEIGAESRPDIDSQLTRSAIREKNFDVSPFPLFLEPQEFDRLNETFVPIILGCRTCRSQPIAREAVIVLESSLSLFFDRCFLRSIVFNLH